MTGTWKLLEDFSYFGVFLYLRYFAKRNLVGDVIGVKGLYTCENASLERFEGEMYTMWFAKLILWKRDWDLFQSQI